MPEKLRRRLWIVVVTVAALAAVTCWLVWPVRFVPEDVEAVSRLPRISPDYVGIVMPPNIAPLNFRIREKGRRFLVRIGGQAEEAIEVISGSPSIRIPPRRWRPLLESNRGKDLQFEVYVQSDGKWRSYEPIVNHVADEEVDEYLVYRLIVPVHNRFREVSVHQRNLSTYESSTVLDGRSLGDACVNCHSFSSNGPQRMLIGIRGGTYRQSPGAETLLADEGRVTRLGQPLGYTAWHPSGRVAAYSTNKVRQFFHSAGLDVRDVVDLESELAYLRFDVHQSQRVPGDSTRQELSTYPAWSPDGRYLYYCRAMLWTDSDTVPPERYAELKYSLWRISYDIATDRWGDPEMVVSAEETGLSILLPRISPDGRFLLFCMCRYGCFPVFQSTSDLYMMDLNQGTYAKCPINSEFSESWHSWSSNSRWIAFSSKRQGGVFTRSYLSFVDDTGQTHKPFVVPQSDPEFYDSLLKTMSVPELLAAPVHVASRALELGARSDEVIPLKAPSGAAPRIFSGAPEP